MTDSITASRKSAKQIIEMLDMRPHPEGGYYSEIYRASQMVDSPYHGGKRAASTSIFYLLEDNEVAKLHKLKSDEVFYFHEGSPVAIHVIEPDGTYRVLRMNGDIGMQQTMVTAGCWYGLEIEGEGYGLIGCAVAPAFEFEDFTMADRDQLLQQFPQHADLIHRFT